MTTITPAHIERLEREIDIAKRQSQNHILHKDHREIFAKQLAILEAFKAMVVAQEMIQAADPYNNHNEEYEKAMKAGAEALALAKKALEG